MTTILRFLMVQPRFCNKVSAIKSSEIGNNCKMPQTVFADEQFMTNSFNNKNCKERVSKILQESRA